MDNTIITRLDIIDNRLAAIEQRLDSITKTHAAAVGDDVVVQPSSRPLSVAEYVFSKNPSDDNQRALVLAGYLETHKRQADFTGDELRQAFLDSRLKAPANVSDKVAKLAKKGLVMQVGEREGRKTWRLTMSGVSQLEEGYAR